MTIENDNDGARVDAALSGDTSFTEEQIQAMGGELDDDLDNFQSTPADRGDIIEEDDDNAEPVGDEKSADGDEDDSEEGDSTGDQDSEDGNEDDADDDSKEGDKADDAEADEDGDGDKEGDDEGDDDDGKKSEQRIPKSRFDEVNARRKQAEDRVKELEAQHKATEEGSKDEFDFDAAEEEYTELVLSGKTKEAIAKRKEIRAAEKAAWEADASEKAVGEVSAREAQAQLNQIVAEFESKYDAFDPEHEDFSEDITDDVAAFYQGYLAKRMPTPEAFRLAVDTAVRLYGLKARGEDTTTDDKGGKKTETRKVEKRDTKKKTKIAKEAPKDTSKAGAAGDSSGDTEIDINNLTDDELDALPESTLKRLRGDVL